MTRDNAHNLAERLVNSDLIAPKTARAIIASLQAAGTDRVQPAQFVAAAKAHKAKVRVVAAALGWARCEHCGQWRDISAEPCEEVIECGCCLELQDDETFAGFALFHYCGGEVSASLSLPASVCERIERYRHQPTARTPLSGQSPAASSKGDASAV